MDILCIDDIFFLANVCLSLFPSSQVFPSVYQTNLAQVYSSSPTPLPSVPSWAAAHVQHGRHGQQLCGFLSQKPAARNEPCRWFRLHPVGAALPYGAAWGWSSPESPGDLHRCQRALQETQDFPHWRYQINDLGRLIISGIIRSGLGSRTQRHRQQNK